MRNVPILVTVLLFLAPSATRAQAPPPVVCGKTKSKRSSLDAKLQARFRALSKNVDGLRAELRAIRKSKGKARSGRIADFKKNALLVRRQARSLGALARQAKANRKTIRHLSDLQRHAGQVATRAGRGMKTRKSLSRTGRLVGAVVRDRNDVAGLLEPVVAR